MKFLNLFLLVLFTFNIGQAATSSTAIPYYGEKFYTDLETGISNNDLKLSLKRVLRSFHRAVKGNMDQIVDSCNGQGCYSQGSIGYNSARVWLLGNFYLHQTTNGEYAIHDVYCDGDKTAKDFRSGIGPAPNKVPDSSVINIEHTWPQSRFTGKFDKNLQKADLHHLFPTDSKANSTRSSNFFGEVTRETKPLDCKASHFGTSASGGREVFEPPQNHKGNVARALFYFSIRYDLPIMPAEETILKKWSKEDPVDDVEILRNNEIFKAQANRNPFIDFPGLEDRITDF